jgi:hypothetical protein
MDRKPRRSLDQMARAAFRHPPFTIGTSLGRTSMMDVVMLALGFVFFALSIGYVYGCDRL